MIEHPLTKLDVEAAFEKFLRLSVADGDASPRTVRAYQDAVRAYAAHAHDPLHATHDDILTYRESLISAGYARATIRLRIVAVRLFYRALQRWGGRPDNPAEGVRAPRPKEADSSSVLAKAVTPDQAKALLAAAGPGRDGAMIRLMLIEGLRVGEVSRVNTQDLSSDGSRLTVRGKGGKRRTLILSYRCRQDLVGLPQGPAFTRRGGKGPLSVRSIERAVNRSLERIGAKTPGKSAHSLRHSFGVLAAMGGASPIAIGEAMGHADLKTTGIYVRAAAAYLEPVTDAVERALK